MTTEHHRQITTTTMTCPRSPELNEIASRFPRIDLALLTINGLRLCPLLKRKIVMTAEAAAELCAVLKQGIAVPIHYPYTAGFVRDYVLLKYDGTPQRFANAVSRRAPETAVRFLAPAEHLLVTGD